MKELNRTMIAGLLISAILMICIPMVAAESAVVSIDDATAPAGGTVKVPIRIADVTDLCGANIWLYYDISVVTVGEVEINDPDPENGASSIDNRMGIAKIAWDTTDGKTDDVLAYVILNAVGAEGDKCTLGINVKELYGCDVGMTDIEYTVQNGTFDVSDDGTEYDSADTDKDCEVSMEELLEQIKRFKRDEVKMEELMESIKKWKLGPTGYC
jgi:hypothetical protein